MNTPMWVGDERGDGECDVDRWTSRVKPHAATIYEVPTVDNYPPSSLEICCNMCKSSSDKRALMFAIDSTGGNLQCFIHPVFVMQSKSVIFEEML